MRSGIGARGDLETLGIKPIIDLPGVGRSLIDHLLVPVVAHPTPGVRHDPLVTNPIGIRYTASGSAEFNDIRCRIEDRLGQPMLLQQMAKAQNCGLVRHLLVAQLIERAAKEPGINDVLALMELSREAAQIEEIMVELSPQPLVTQVSGTAGWVW